MMLRQLLPQPVVKALKKARHTFRLLRRSIGNSVRAFRSADLDYHIAIDRFGAFDVAYRAGTADEQVLAQSFVNDIFLSRVPEYKPGADDVILDVGAHIGGFTLLAASLVPQGRVFAVEACQDTFNLLRINVALNGIRNIETRHVALSDQKGQTTLYYDEGNWGHSITKRMTPRGEVVAAETLSGFMSDRKIDHCDFVKFNCEGAEFPVILSTPVDVLHRIKRMLVLYHGDLVEGYTADALGQHLLASGFQVRFFNQTSQRGWIFADRSPKS